jgi:hypothetical protein
MAIQRIVDNEGVKSSSERGRGLGMVVQPAIRIEVEGETKK